MKQLLASYYPDQIKTSSEWLLFSVAKFGWKIEPKLMLEFPHNNSQGTDSLLMMLILLVLHMLYMLRIRLSDFVWDLDDLH